MDALFKNTAYMIFEVFLKNPKKLYSARGLGRELGVTHATVAKYLAELHKIGLVLKLDGGYPLYKANRKSEKFREYERIKALFDYHGKPPEFAHKKHKGYML